MNNNGENQNLNAESVLTPITGEQTSSSPAPQPAQQPQVVQPSVVASTPTVQPAQPAQVIQPSVQVPQNPVQVPAAAPTPVPVAPEPNPVPTVQSALVDDNKDSSYQASTSNLNSAEQPLNQDATASTSPDDMNDYDGDDEPVVIKKKSKIAPFLLLIILGLGSYLLFTTKDYHNKIETMKYNCTPVTSYKEEKELDLNSTLVQDLYTKVHTSIREDVAQPEWDDTMKLYLAYRQIPEYEKYDSNCNLFDPSKMEPYTCAESSTSKPKAFKASTLELEFKKLFGEDTLFEFQNIKLVNSCIGGYQYIADRGEYVEGTCDQQTATSFKVEKQLSKAVTYRNTIVLTENVKYRSNESMELPSFLKSGEYIYTFRLDVNYNYVLISKVYNDKYN